jgi:tetratricopeptide (TPR) repeat protein
VLRFPCPRTPGPSAFRTFAFLASFGIGVGGVGCSGASPTASGASRAELERRAVTNPNDAEALRRLGSLLAGEQEYARAYEVLQQANERAPGDPETLYLLALSSEVLGKTDTALRLYERYETVPTSSPFRDQMQSRYGWLLRKEVRRELRARVDSLDQMLGDMQAAGDTSAEVGPEAPLAVLPLTYRNGPKEYAPLGRGLAEFISIDLAAVPQLTVVERLRVQGLLNEFEMAREGALDTESAPRVGRLIRTERLVGGQYDVRDGELSVQATAYRPSAGELPELETSSGPMDDLFAVQKEVVRGVLRQLGVEPPADVQARIARRQTSSFPAFLAFSRGLQAEDQGDYDRANDLYDEALRLDPGFSLAAQYGASAGSAMRGGGDAEALLAITAARPELFSSDGLVGRRLNRVAGTLGQQIVPADEDRDAVGEGSGAGILGPLPDPPPPPGDDL